MRSLSLPVATWVFDLDNTLYPADHSLFPQIDVRIRAYIAEHLSLTLDDAFRLQKQYYREYGTTLRGLMEVHNTDPLDFLRFVHKIDHSVLKPDFRLDAVLDALSGQKLVFTNGSRDHAEQVLLHLGIGRHFDGIFDIVDADFIPKPNLQPYRMIGERFQINFSQTVMVEDLERNLVPAAQLGMTTVWVKQDHHPDLPFLSVTPDNPTHVDYTIRDLSEWLEHVVDSDPELKSSCS